MTKTLVCLAPNPMATIRLVTIPFAGAGVSVYRAWAAHLPTSMELWGIQLPGREERLPEPCFTVWEKAVGGIADALTQLPSGKVALFGHSLGALLALDFARQADREPDHLFISGRPWPGIEAKGMPVTFLDQMSDDDLLLALEDRFGPMPTSFDDPDIRELALPILRADLGLLARYLWPGPAGLTCPLTVFYGRDDPALSTQSAEGWAKETSGAFRAIELDAGHYCIDSQARQFTAAIARGVRAG